MKRSRVVGVCMTSLVGLILWVPTAWCDEVSDLKNIEKDRLIIFPDMRDLREQILNQAFAAARQDLMNIFQAQGNLNSNLRDLLRSLPRDFLERVLPPLKADVSGIRNDLMALRDDLKARDFAAAQKALQDLAKQENQLSKDLKPIVSQVLANSGGAKPHVGQVSPAAGSRR